MREYIHNGFHVLMDEDHAKSVGAIPVKAEPRPAAKAAPAPENKSAAPAARKRRPTAKNDDVEE